MASYTELPFIEQVRIQARVLMPVIKAFQAEFGEERVKQIVERALGDMLRKVIKQVSQNSPGTIIDKLVAGMQFHHGDALEVEVLKQTDDAFEFNVTECRYADLYKELGEPELGYLLLCRMDFPMAEGFSPDLELERKQTIMQGATYCDFRYRLNSKE